MGKDSKIVRPDSYALDEHSAGHLLMLSQRLVSFIDAMRPAFAKAEKGISWTQDSKEVIAACVRAGEKSRPYRSADDLLGWLELKATRLADLIPKVEDGATNLDGKALNNLRQIRAFFILFKKVANDEYGEKSLFRVTEPILDKLLADEFFPKAERGGILKIFTFLLDNEDAKSGTNLAIIDKELKVFETIQAVVKAQKALTIEKLKVVEVPEIPAAPETQIQVKKPQPVAAREFRKELELNVQKNERVKPELIKPKKTHKPRGEKPQHPELALR